MRAAAILTILHFHVNRVLIPLHGSSPCVCMCFHFPWLNLWHNQWDLTSRKPLGNVLDGVLATAGAIFSCLSTTQNHKQKIQHCECFGGQGREEMGWEQEKSRSKWIQTSFPHKFLWCLAGAEERVGEFCRHPMAKHHFLEERAASTAFHGVNSWRLCKIHWTFGRRNSSIHRVSTIATVNVGHVHISQDNKFVFSGTLSWWSSSKILNDVAW